MQRALAMIDVDPSVKGNPLPEGAVEADVELLAQHNNSYSLPLFYVDRPFVCRDCGSRVGCVRRAGTDLEPCAKACARRNAPFPAQTLRQKVRYAPRGASGLGAIIGPRGALNGGGFWKRGTNAPYIGSRRVR